MVEEKKVAIRWQGARKMSPVAKTLRFAVVDEEGSSYRRNAKEMRKFFSSRRMGDRLHHRLHLWTMPGCMSRFIPHNL